MADDQFGIIEMDDFYQQNILDHARHPRNSGQLDSPTVSREEYNPLCGDKVRFDLVIEGEVIKDVRFSGRGCAISQAAASMLAEEIKGKPLDEVRQIGKEEILDLLGIPIGYTRLKCALLGLKAVKVGVYSAMNEEYDDDELLS
jgi:nitrogen fixation protein NifU and related proteins